MQVGREESPRQKCIGCEALFDAELSNAKRKNRSEGSRTVESRDAYRIEMANQGRGKLGSTLEPAIGMACRATQENPQYELGGISHVHH